MGSNLETALAWREKGYAVIPIHYQSKKAKVAWENYQKELPDTELVKSWFGSSLTNIGLVMGWNGLVVIDFDNLEAHTKWMIWCGRKGSIALEVALNSYQVQTARGMHVYIRLPFSVHTTKLPGIDIKGSGYVLVPPSLHPSGVAYQERNPSAPIIMIEALSDILPAELLTINTEYTGGVVNPVPFQANSEDPWQSAEQVLDPKKDLVNQVRARYQIEQFFPQAVHSGGNGRWMMAKCPFHDDHDPSFWIDVSRQICGCYSGCTPKPLDVINLFGRLHGLTNRDAILAMMKGL
jgi:hypothetical protein